MRQHLPAFIGLAILAALLRVRFAFALITVLGVLVAVSWWVGGRGRQVGIVRTAPDRGFIGDHLTVDLAITNPGKRRVGWVEISESVPQTLMSGGATPPPRWVLELAAGETRRVSYPIVPRVRGYHELGPTTGESGDTFGVRSTEIAGGPSSRVIVYPRVVPIARLNLVTRAAVPALAAPQALMEDPTRIRGIRGYSPGDSMRSIHWSASANVGQLMVRQLDPSTARTTAIALNLVQRDFRPGSRSSGVELAIIAAASLLVHVISQEDQPAGLLAVGHDPLSGIAGAGEFAPRSERAHLMQMLDYLARVQAAPEGSFVETLRRSAARLPWAASIVIVTGSVDDHLTAVTLQLKRRGFAPTVLLVQSDGRGQGDEARTLRGRGVAVRRVDRASDLGGLG